MAEPLFFGPYRAEKIIGQGGMGVVYRAVHDTTREVVAVKVVSAAVGDNPKFRRRFHSEIETLMKLDHPNIVRLIGFGEERGQLFYSMELVEGPSLQQHLRVIKKLSWEETIRIAIEICGALKHAHDSGVIHRDIKPANLLMGTNGRTMLTDFGIAKLFGASDVTAAGSVLGTADYMAPEQADGLTVTARTDLYAVGSVLYACLAGRAPFTGRQLTSVLHALKHDAPPPLDLINPDAPEELIELINQLLAKEPAQRPPTALAVGNRLKAMQAGLQKRKSTAIQPNLSDSLTLAEPSINPGAVTHFTGSAVAPSIGPNAATIASQPEIGNPATSPSSVTEVRTHFKTVDESDRRRASTPMTVALDDTQDHSGLWLSAAGLAALLFGLIGLGWWMMRSPSADQLYAEIAEARDSGEPEAVASQVKQFLLSYSQDARAAEVQDVAAALDVESSIRRLQHQARRAGGADRLDPPRMALLEALQFRQDQPQVAEKRLALWLQVFGNDSAPDPDIRRLSAIARVVLEDMQQTPRAATDDRQAELDRWLDWAAKNLTGQAKQDFYSGFIELFSGKPWAKAAVERATKAGS